MAIGSDLNPTGDVPAEEEATPIDPVTGEETSADPVVAALLRERLGIQRRIEGATDPAKSAVLTARLGNIEDEIVKHGYVRVERAEKPKGKRERATKE